MSFETIKTEHRINVISGNKILVPGCEPQSTISSTTLAKEQQEDGICNGALVDLDDALDAIPGSRVILGMNWGNLGTQKFFVLPPVDNSLCCRGSIALEDYYAVLRGLPSAETEQDLENIVDNCDSFNNYQCDGSILERTFDDPRALNRTELPPASQSRGRCI